MFDRKAYDKVYRKKWAKEHQEQRKAYRIKWKSEHPEQMKASRKKWKIEHPEAVKASNKKCGKKYRIEHKKQTKKRDKNYRKTHREQRAIILSNWLKTENGKIYLKERDAKKRQRGFVPLNKYFEGARGHHINRNYAIYVPKELHESVPHNLTTNWNMKKINNLSFVYLKK